MATSKHPSNLLALAVLSLLSEHPMHPYEISVLMRHRGMEDNIKSSHGSIYSVIEGLERSGMVNAQETSREGRRPERTVYSITPDGKALLHAWLRDLLANPAKEYPRFTAALSLVGHIPRDEIVDILEDRLGLLSDRLKVDRSARNQMTGVIPRVFMIETEYDDAMRAAEVAWLRRTIAEIREGAFPWPLIVDGRLTWPDGNETFQVPEISLDEGAASARDMEGRTGKK
jgi:DNA-binding PadR family transcriptional regulator